MKFTKSMIISIVVSIVVAGATTIILNSIGLETAPIIVIAVTLSTISSAVIVYL